MNSRKNHIYVILSPNYAHSAYNIDVKFARLTIANPSVLWNSLTFPWFFGQFSNFLTFPGFPGSLVTMIHGFIAMEHWKYYGNNPKTQSSLGNSTPLEILFSYLAAFSFFRQHLWLLLFLKNPIERWEFSVVRIKLKIFVNFL